jgi:hypothetical protein
MHAHARSIAIQNQWDLTRMRKDRFKICSRNAEEIWAGKEERYLFTLITILFVQKCFLPLKL